VYDQLALIHLALIAPAPLLGAYLLVRKKGTPRHRQLGKFYMLIMCLSAVISLFMPAQIGPQFVWHWGWIHVLSFWTLICVYLALRSVRAGNILAHKLFMVGLYIGMMIAFAFTFAQGRLLGQLIN